MRNLGRLACLLVLLIGLAGCAGSALKVAPISMSDNPSTNIAQLEKDLAEARATQIHVLAPTWYGEAEDFLTKARSGLANKDSVGKVLQNVAYGHAHLDRAKEYALIAQSAIAQAIKARELANAAGAGVFGDDYLRVETAFIALTADIENNNLSRAEKNEAKVAQDFADLELRAIKENTLGTVRQLLTAAESDDAKKIAPKTLAVAQKSLEEADQFITQQRYERERMQEKANHALFQAQRLGQVMKVSNQVKTMQPEDIALWHESSLHR